MKAGGSCDVSPTSTPLSITGVEKFDTLEFGIDYAKFTIYTDKLGAMEIYSKIFADILGDLILEGRTKHYQERYINGGGFSLNANPARKSGFKTYAQFNMPGSICQLIPLEKFTQLAQLCQQEGIFLTCTRLDIRIDNCPFEPLEIAKDIEEGRVESRAQRDTLKKFDQPFDTNELGEMGTTGMYLGSRESEKFLRIYDKHGFTRLELECKGEASDTYFYILQQSTWDFETLAMGFILDFIRVDSDNWRRFSTGFKRAYAITKTFSDPTLERLEKFMVLQASNALGILLEIKGEEYIKAIAKKGLEAARKKARYYPLLHAYGIAEE